MVQTQPSIENKTFNPPNKQEAIITSHKQTCIYRYYIKDKRKKGTNKDRKQKEQ